MQYRERVTRGSPGFPFAHYIMENNDTYKNMAETHWHPEIEIYYVVEGEIIATVSEVNQILKSGDIFFINPEELHSVSPYKLPVKYHAAVFSMSLFEFKETNFFEQNFTLPVESGRLLFPRLITKTHPFYSEIEPLLNRIFGADSKSEILIFSDLIALFTLLINNSLMTQSSESSVDKHSEDIKLCIKYMEENYQEKIHLSDLSELIHMSPNYFCGYFKNYVGVSPFTQLNLIRIKKASEQLIISNNSIVTVAENCGFDNTSFFIRKFKEIMGCTPSVFRKKRDSNR